MLGLYTVTGTNTQILKAAIKVKVVYNYTHYFPPFSLWNPDQAIRCGDSGVLDEWCDWLEVGEDEPDGVMNSKRQVLTEKDEKGWTCIHYAAQHECIDILQAADQLSEGTYMYVCIIYCTCTVAAKKI